MSTAVPVRVGLPAVALGGAVGALARWLVTEAFPLQYDGFPWAVLSVNVVGSGLLALLPSIPAVRARPWLAVGLGTGVLGGFTTMSTASVDTVLLLEAGRGLVALLYAAGTLLAAMLAVGLVDRLSTPAERAEFEREEGDE